MYFIKPAEGVLRPKRAVKEVRIELVFARLEPYEGALREVYRPKGLLAYTTAAREYVRLI